MARKILRIALPAALLVLLLLNIAWLLFPRKAAVPVQVLIDQGRYDEALKETERQLAAGASAAAMSELAAGIIDVRGMPREAIPFLELVIRRGAQTPEPYIFLGNARWELRQQEEAIAVVREGLGKFPRDRELRSDLALYQMYRGRSAQSPAQARGDAWKEAVALLRAMQKERLPVSDVETLFHLYLGQYPAALRSIDDLLAHGREYPHDTDILQAGVCGAIISILGGEKERARAYLERARASLRQWSRETRDLFAPAIVDMDLVAAVFLGEKIAVEAIRKRARFKSQWEGTGRVLRLTDALELESVDGLLAAMSARDSVAQRRFLERLIEVQKNYPGCCDWSLALVTPFLQSTYHCLLRDILRESGEPRRARAHEVEARRIFPANPLLGKEKGGH